MKEKSYVLEILKEHARKNGLPPPREVQMPGIDHWRPPAGTKCKDPMHGIGHHWCSEIDGYTGGLRPRHPRR